MHPNLYRRSRTRGEFQGSIILLAGINGKNRIALSDRRVWYRNQIVRVVFGPGMEKAGRRPAIRSPLVAVEVPTKAIVVQFSG